MNEETYTFGIEKFTMEDTMHAEMRFYHKYVRQFSLVLVCTIIAGPKKEVQDSNRPIVDT